MNVLLGTDSSVVSSMTSGIITEAILSIWLQFGGRSDFLFGRARTCCLPNLHARPEIMDYVWFKAAIINH